MTLTPDGMCEVQANLARINIDRVHNEIKELEKKIQKLQEELPMWEEQDRVFTEALTTLRAAQVKKYAVATFGMAYPPKLDGLENG